jgi:hypothetical protein
MASIIPPGLATELVANGGIDKLQAWLARQFSGESILSGDF